MAARREQWDAIIVGGSLTGLMYGIILKRQGRSVCILEQATTSTRSNTAAGIGISLNGQNFLKAYDLLTTPFSFPVLGSENYNAKGKVKSKTQASFKLTTWDALHNRLRANFDGYSNGYFSTPEDLPGDGEVTYSQGKRVTNFTVEKEVVHVVCEDLENFTQLEYRCGLLIAADGLNSTIRRTIAPEVKLKYSGYVAWRATVPESQLSPAIQNSFNKLRTYGLPNSLGYVVVYNIPGEQGTLEPGRRSINLVWYEDASQEILIDSEGHKHRTTLPQGKMPDLAWAKQVEKAVQAMPTHVREVCEKASKPFISTVNDCQAPKASWHGGKVILAGEALLLIRPHTGAGFDTCAYAAMEFAKNPDWERSVQRHNNRAKIMSIAYGEYLLYGPMRPIFWWHSLQFLWVLLISPVQRFF